jgi:hypothetical protein
MKLTRRQLFKIIRESINARSLITDLISLRDYFSSNKLGEFISLASADEKERVNQQKLTFNPQTVSNSQNMLVYIKRALRQEQGVQKYKVDAHMVLCNFLSGITRAMLESENCDSYYKTHKNSFYNPQMVQKALVYEEFHKLAHRICREHGKEFDHPNFYDKYSDLSDRARQRLSDLLGGQNENT